MGQEGPIRAGIGRDEEDTAAPARLVQMGPWSVQGDGMQESQETGQKQAACWKLSGGELNLHAINGLVNERSWALEMQVYWKRPEHRAGHEQPSRLGFRTTRPGPRSSRP